MAKRKSTKYPGVYYRESQNKDKVFYIVYKENKKSKELKVGKFSEGMRVEHANNIRMSVISSLRLGTDAPDILNGTQKREEITFDSIVDLYFQNKALHNMTNNQSKGKYTSQLKQFMGNMDLYSISKKDRVKTT